MPRCQCFGTICAIYSILKSDRILENRKRKMLKKAHIYPQKKKKKKDKNVIIIENRVNISIF